MKSVFVLMSSGVDSTYLALRLLNAGFAVKAGYVEICNNRSKTNAELHALDALSSLIQAQFPRFQYHNTIYRAYNLTSSASNLRFKQVPYFLHALTIAPATDYRALGYVRGDSAIRSLENIRQVYNSYKLICHSNFAPLVFPIKNIGKPSILHYMKAQYPSILKHCVWCANPLGQDFIPCGSCSPCIRRQKEAA